MTSMVTAGETDLPPGQNDAVIQTIRRGRKAVGSDEIIAENAGKLDNKTRDRPAAGQLPVQWRARAGTASDRRRRAKWDEATGT
jgi:hypothetical protein